MICYYVCSFRDVKSIFGANGIIKKTFSATAIQGTMVNTFFSPYCITIDFFFYIFQFLYKFKLMLDIQCKKNCL